MKSIDADIFALHFVDHMTFDPDEFKIRVTIFGILSACNLQKLNKVLQNHFYDFSEIWSFDSDLVLEYRYSRPVPMTVILE